jgi:hypothetical protein
MPTLLALALTSVLAIQAPPDAVQADAKYYFLVGRHLESAGKVDEAVAAFKEGDRALSRRALSRARSSRASTRDRTRRARRSKRRKTR